MTKSMGVAEIKVRFSEVLREVEHRGGAVVVERHGRPIAVIEAYRPERLTPKSHWTDVLDGIAADIDDFSEVMETVVSSRDSYPPRPVELDEGG